MSAPGERRDRLRRILKVKEQMRLAEEWRAARLKREREALDADDAAALESLGDFEEIAGFFIENKVKALKRNEVRRTANLAEGQASEARLTRIRREEKGTRRLHDEAGREATRQDAAGALDASIEAELARRRASLE